MKPNRNGAGAGRRKMPHAQKKHAQFPIGKPPKRLTDAEAQVWNEQVAASPWLDKTHRRWLESMSKTCARLDAIHEFFNKRRDEYIAAGKHGALSTLTDGGDRHPQTLECEELTGLLVELAAEYERHKGEKFGNTETEAYRKAVATVKESKAAREEAELSKLRQSYLR